MPVCDCSPQRWPTPDNEYTSCLLARETSLRNPFSNRRSARFFIVGSVRLMDLSSWDRIVKFNWENFSSSGTVFFSRCIFRRVVQKFLIPLGRTDSRKRYEISSAVSFALSLLFKAIKYVRRSECFLFILKKSFKRTLNRCHERLIDKS